MGPDGVPGDVLKLGGDVMFPYLARLLGITILLFQVTGKEPYWFLLTRGRSICSHNLQTSQFNLGALQANGTLHNRIPKGSLRYE